MTLEDLTQFLGTHPLALAIALGVPPLLALLLAPVHGAGNGGRTPYKYLYSVLVYAVCIPGIFAAVLTGYLFLFRNENLLQLDLLVYVLPLVTMLVSLLLIRKNVGTFEQVPGFGRLSGLMVLLAVSFALAFALHRLHFGIFFFGPLAQLGAIALIVFALLHWGANKFGGKKEERSMDEVLKGK